MKDQHTELPELIKRHRLIAILRGVPPQHAPRLAEGLHRAGIRLLEVAFSDEYGEPGLRAIKAAFGDELLLGAGTVTTLERAERARQAGATFVLTPHLVPEVNAYALQHQLGLISGAMTPSEIQQARAQGSGVVKLFPAGDLGVGYLKSLLGPYPELPLLVVGNIGPANLADFLRAGALGAGIGGALTRTDWNAPDFQQLEAGAAQLVALTRGAVG